MLMLQPFQVFNFFLMQENGTLIFSSLFLLCKKLKPHVFLLAKKWNTQFPASFSGELGEQMEGPCISLLTKKWNTKFSAFFSWGTWGTNEGPMYFSLDKNVEYPISSFFLGSKWRAHVFSHNKKGGVLISKLFSPGRKMEPMSF